MMKKIKMEPTKLDLINLTTLKNAIDSVERGLVDAGVINILTEVVTCLNNPTTPVLLSEAVTQLAVALFTHGLARKLMTTQSRIVVDALFSCLKNKAQKPVLHHNILKAIGNLAEEDDPSQNWLVSEHNAVDVIVEILKEYPTMPDLLAQAFYALQKISCGNEVNIRLVFNHRVHELALLSLTQSTYIPLLTQALAILRRLSFVEEARSTLMTMSCTVALSTMRSFASVAEIQEHGCGLIRNLACNADNDKLLTREPYFAHEVILAAMRTHSHVAVVQEIGCWALCNLSINDENQQLFVRRPNLAHEVVLAAMRDHCDIASVQRYGCGTLLRLAINANNQELLVSKPHLAHEAILAAMRNHPQNPLVQSTACDALWNLAGHSDNKKLLVSEPHLVHQAILTAMHNHPQDVLVQEAGCGALSNLSVNSDNQKLLVQCEAHLAILAVFRAHQQHEQVNLQAVWTMSNLSFHAFNMSIFQRAGVVELCHKAHRAFPNNTKLLEKLIILENHVLNYAE